MKPVKMYYIALALVLGACSTGRYVVQGDEYDDVYLVSSDFQKAEARAEQRLVESGTLPTEAYNSEYDQRPISNYANPDAMDFPVGSNPNSVVYYPINNQYANWNNYNSWNNNTFWDNGWNDCWNCWGGGWNSWNSPYYYNSWNRPWGWNSWNSGWGVGYGWGWNSWNRPWGWNSWNSGWGWNGWGGNTIIIDNRTPSKIQVAPRASAGRGSSFIRNTPNPRLQNNPTVTNPSNGDQQGGRIANTTGGRTRNVASNTYTPTQSNEVRIGRTRNENTNNSGRYNSSVSGGRNEAGSLSSGRNNSNRSSYSSSGRSNSNSSYSSGRSNSSSSYSSGRSSSSSSSSSSGRSRGSSSGSSGRSGGGGRSPR